MTTTGTRAVVNTGKGKLDTILKKSRWVWRPKGNYWIMCPKTVDPFKLKRLSNPEILLQDHAVVDSGCSSHMTGNKAYLSDYKISIKALFLEGSERIAPRKDDVYSLDLKKIVPSRGIQDLFIVPGHQEKIKGPTRNTYASDSQPHKDKDSNSKDTANKESKQDLQDKLKKMVTQELAVKSMDDVSRQAFEEEKRRIASQRKATQATSTNKLSTNRPFVSTNRVANAGEYIILSILEENTIDASTLPNADLPTNSKYVLTWKCF
ncbi:hypothetical protein Tco_0664238 [Tanacetum coccineum]